MAGGLNLYGYAGGDPINNSDPFGLKVDLSGLTRSQRRTVQRMYGESEAFRAMYDAVHAQEYTVTVRAPRDRHEAATMAIYGGGRYDHDSKQMVFSRSGDPRHPDDHAEFESLVAHEFAHAAAGLAGGTPSECKDDSNGSACAVAEQNKVHQQTGMRDRKNYQDVGPFKQPKSPE